MAKRWLWPTHEGQKKQGRRYLKAAIFKSNLLVVPSRTWWFTEFFHKATAQLAVLLCAPHHGSPWDQQTLLI